MKEQHKTRLNFDFPPELHKHLKIEAAKLGLSIRELATQAIIEKLEALELQEDIEIFDRKMKEYKAGKLKTIPHAEMMKNLGWDEL